MKALLPISICSATLHETPKPGKTGEVLWLMQFTANVGPFLFSKINFGFLPAKQKFCLNFPNDGRDRRCYCADNEQREAIITAAAAVYESMGGPNAHSAALLPLATAPQSPEPSHDLA